MAALPAASAATAAVAALAATAAAPVAAVSAAPTPAAAAAKGRTLFARARFIDGQRAAIPFLAVQFADRGIHGSIGVHRDKGKAARAAAVPVSREMDIGHGAKLAEEIAKLGFSGTKGEIPHIHFGIHLSVVVCFSCRTAVGARLSPGFGFLTAVATCFAGSRTA